jgi:hypothetical protein
MKCYENPSSGSRIVPYRRTDTQTDRHTDGQTHRRTKGRADMMKLTVASSNFVNAPKTAVSGVDKAAVDPWVKEGPKPTA